MSNLPYVTSPGTIDKALAGIRSAAVPERVSQDFVKTILKIAGGSGDQMTSFLKKIGLVSQDGTPNETYRRFRNPSSSGVAISECIKNAYAPLYKRNEYMHELSDPQLLGLVVEETGSAHDSANVRFIVSCIKHLKAFANFSKQEVTPVLEKIQEKIHDHANDSQFKERKYGLNIGYTLNLNLPATADPAVFDAIFKSLKEHLLSDDDA